MATGPRAPGRRAERLGALLAGLWAGVLACIGALATPAAFAVLPAVDAGRFAGRLFAQEADLSLVLSLLLFLLERQRGRAAADAGTGRVFGTDLMLVLGALFCTVAGYFALLPLMEAARAGQGRWSFGMLHGVSAGFFLLKGLLVLALAWRLTAALVRTTATPS